MTDKNNIPDIDKKLARKIGSWLDENRPFDEKDDPVLSDLNLYKSNIKASHDSKKSKDVVWNQLQNRINNETVSEKRQKRAKVTRLFPQSSFQRYAVAATILIAAFAAIFFLRPKPEFEWVAESGSSIEQITLNDGSRVILRPNSLLQKNLKSDSEYSFFLKGEAYFDVVSGTDRVFSVTAGEGVVEVLGTKFNVREWSGQTEVFLEEGSVRFALADGTSDVTLEPGQSSLITENLKLREPESVNPDQYTAWQNLELVFDSRQTRQLLLELEHHFSIRITAPNHIMDESLRGRITLSNKEQALNDIGRVLGGEFVSSDQTNYNFKEDL